MQRSLYTQSGILILVERQSRTRLCHLYKINHLTSYLGIESPQKTFLREPVNSGSRAFSFLDPGTTPLWNSLPHNICFLAHIPYFYLSFVIINYTNTVLFWFHIHFSYLATHVTSAYILSLLPAEIIINKNL